MSLAKLLIGEPALKAESKTLPEAEETPTQPVHAMDLIDALAEDEFGFAESAASHKSPGHPTPGGAAPSAMKKGKEQRGKVTSGKTTKGQVASAPGSVHYGVKHSK